MIEIKRDDKRFPQNLSNIKKPPKKLFVEGNIDNLNLIGFAIVGSRNCSCYGKRMCEKFTNELTNYNITIISGLAVGIDTYAHKMCLKNKGKTIAVLPCGLNKIYPKENEKLVKEILESNGTVISEYEPDEKANSKRFLERNRIVSGLAMGTLIVEAGYRSGTSVTARITKEQGKNVFCIPSSLENRRGIVTNELIQKGAFLVTNINDILEKYEDIEFCPKENSENINIKKEYIQIYNALGEEPIDINEICRKINISIDEVNYKLMLMELDGLVTSIVGDKYVKN